jgi:hypothetical protein
MPTRWSTFPVEFRGGLISNLSPLQQGINAIGSATLLQNYEPSKGGGYKKILGYEKYIDDVVPGSGPVLGVRVANPSKVIAVRQNTSGNSEYYINNVGVWASLGAASGLGGKVFAADFNFDGTDKILFVDGVNSPAVFKDDTDTLNFPSGYPSDVVGAEFVEVYKQHVFLSKGSVVSFSAPYDETNFDVAAGAGNIDVGQTVTGLKVFRDQLFIFSRNSIQRLVGNSVADFQLVPVTKDIGCISGDSIQEVGGDVMFLSVDGLRLLSATDRIGDFGLGLPSQPIEKDILKFMSVFDSFTSLVIRQKAQYRIFGYRESDSQENSKGVIGTKFAAQGPEGFQWAETKGIKAFVADGRYVPNFELIVFANDDGYVYRLESGSSFDGNNIQAIYESPFMPIDDPQTRKTLYKLTLFVDTGGLFSVIVDFNFDLYKIKNYNEQAQPPTIVLENLETSSVAIYGQPDATYGEDSYGKELDKVYNTPVIGAGNTFSFRIEDNSTNPSHSLDTAVFEYATFDRR